MRKYVFAVLMAIMLSLPLAACRYGKKTLMESEADPRCLHIGSYAAQNNDTLYFLLMSDRSRMMYVDLGNADAGYLCGRPECSHDTAACNSYLGTEEPSVGYQAAGLGLGAAGEGIGYVFDDGTDISAAYMKADGSSHELLRTLASVESNSFPRNGGIPPFFHKGIVFACGQTSEIVDGTWVSENRIMAYLLNTKDEAVTVFSEKFTHDYGGLLIYPAGDLIWYAVIGGDMDGGEGPMDVHLRVYTWDIDGRKTETVFDDDIPGMVYEWTVAADGVYFTSAADDAIYRLDPEEKSFELYRRFDEGRSGFMTMYLCGEYVIGFELPEAGMQRIRVEDLAGNEIADDTKEQLPSEFGRAFLGIYNGKVYYRCESMYGDEESLMEFDLKTLEKKIIWMTKN